MGIDEGFGLGDAVREFRSVGGGDRLDFVPYRLVAKRLAQG